MGGLNRLNHGPEQKGHFRHYASSSPLGFTRHAPLLESKTSHALDQIPFFPRLPRPALPQRANLLFSSNVNELGLDPNQVLTWFPHEMEEPYTLVRVSAANANRWEAALRDAVRRCYLSDETLRNRAQETESELQGTFESRQAIILQSKLPDPSATMAGDFGEILIYAYQAARARPSATIGPKKWRLKETRTKAAPYSDVVQFILPSWPVPSAQDEVLCAEVKLKSTASTFNPIKVALEGCENDRISRLSKTLVWLKDRAISENLGEVQLAHLNRFINATDHPAATKRFRAVAVICGNLVNAELSNAPQQPSPEYELVVIAVPNLHAVYNAVFQAVKASTLPALPPQ